MSIKVRGRDGVTREVDGAYVLQDGETFVVALTMMDAMRVIHDGHGHPAGQRPGFLYADDERAERARLDAYRQYATDISERWRRGQPAKQAQSENFGSGEAAVAAAYAEYDRTISERWRK